MKTLLRLLPALALGASLLMLSAAASALGIATQPGAMAPDARAKLEAQIQAERAKNPGAFAAVANVKGHRPEHYKHNRNPYPTVTRELRGMGPAALLPMLEALAFKAPPRGDLKDAEWDALAIGMFEAVGGLRDARSRPVLHAAFGNKSLRPEVLGAVGRALGRLGGDPELQLLTKHAVSGDPLELPAVMGLGELRRIESAQHLAKHLQATKSEQVAAAIADALGMLGSSWAWRALGPSQEKTGLSVREVCARALATTIAKRGSAAQSAASDSLLMVEHPNAIGILRSARPASGAGAKAIDRAIDRLNRQQSRQKR